MSTTLRNTTIVVRSGSSDHPLVAAPKANGPAAAAILAAGIGCFSLGLLVIFSEAIPSLKNALTFYAPVGPLSGKTIVQVVVYCIAWATLAYAWRGRNVAFARVYAATLVLIGLGLIGTFPLVYEVFTAK